MGRLFGSSGIRGPYPDPISPEFALRLGSAAATLSRRILVGHDVRLSSPMLSAAFSAGALAQGADVCLAGGAATPSLAYSARRHDAAVTVTASHNPPPDNGFKFWNPDGSAWDTGQEESVEERLGRPAGSLPEWRHLLAPFEDADVSRRHAQAALAFAGPLEGSVTVDCGNGAGAFVTPGLLRSAGLDVRVLFGEPDGRFPNRASEPREDHLAELRRRCAADHTWGIAHDGDADRMVPVDPDGRVVPPDRVLVTLALLRGAVRIAVPIDASLALERALPGAAWHLTRVGDASVSAALRANGGDLGGETSGTYIVPGFDYAPDGPLAALLFLHAAKQGLVEEAARRLGVVHRRTATVPMDPASIPEFRRSLAAVAPGQGERATRVDGLRLDGGDGWVLVRPSGTEPIVRVTAEGHRPADAARLLERGLSLVATLGGPARAATPPPLR